MRSKRSIAYYRKVGKPGEGRDYRAVANKRNPDVAIKGLPPGLASERC